MSGETRIWFQAWWPQRTYLSPPDHLSPEDGSSVLLSFSLGCCNSSVFSRLTLFWTISHWFFKADFPQVTDSNDLTCIQPCLCVRTVPSALLGCGPFILTRTSGPCDFPFIFQMGRGKHRGVGKPDQVHTAREQGSSDCVMIRLEGYTDSLIS